MAESCAKAFGRYLRILRERRGLSMDDVRSLSQTFPDPITKSYLSRCENGHQSLAFSKLVPLSRIYEVPADVLLEKMELDSELERVGGPETEGKSYGELTEAGRAALDTGQLWDAYAYLRDALIAAPKDALLPRMLDKEEQTANAAINFATASRALGRYQLALHELHHMLLSEPIRSARLRPLLLERLSTVYRCLGDSVRSEAYTAKAIYEAENGDATFVGYVFDSTAINAHKRAACREALGLYKRAYECHKALGNEAAKARTLSNLSQCYADLRRFGAARRAAEAALSLAKDLGEQRTVVLANLLLGDLEEREAKLGSATSRRKFAARTARGINDRRLRFKAEFALLQTALRTEDRAVVRAIHRRLRRLAAWVPKDTQELEDYRALVASHPEYFSLPVSAAQQRPTESRN